MSFKLGSGGERPSNLVEEGRRSLKLGSREGSTSNLVQELKVGAEAPSSPALVVALKPILARGAGDLLCGGGRLFHP